MGTPSHARSRQTNEEVTLPHAGHLEPSSYLKDQFEGRSIGKAPNDTE